MEENVENPNPRPSSGVIGTIIAIAAIVCVIFLFSSKASNASLESVKKIVEKTQSDLSIVNNNANLANKKADTALSMGQRNSEIITGLKGADTVLTNEILNLKKLRISDLEKAKADSNVIANKINTIKVNQKNIYGIVISLYKLEENAIKRDSLKIDTLERKNNNAHLVNIKKRLGIK